MHMKKRRLTADMEIAPLVFGGNVFGWTLDAPASFRMLDAFTSAGFQLIDTADVYANWKPGNKGGESETIIGNWLRQRGARDKVYIATKVGGDMGEGKNLKKAYILKAAEASLRRLQTDYIDLYQTHWDDVSTPVEETMEAYAQLVKAGKVRAIGASNISPERLDQSIRLAREAGLPAYSVLQPEYNLYDREKYEKDYVPIVENSGMGVIPYYALASGFLSGKYRAASDASKSARGGGIIKRYLNEKGFRILEALDTVADRHRTAPASIALAWLLTRPGITAPIASATTPAQLEELAAAVRLELNGDDRELLNAASAY